MADTSITNDRQIQDTAADLEVCHALPETPETPFTKAKRKRVLDHDNEGDEDVVRPKTALQDPFTPSGQRSDRTRQATGPITPCMSRNDFVERLNSHTASLPTSGSQECTAANNNMANNNMAGQSRLLHSSPISLTRKSPNKGISRSPEGESDLTTAVLELIRSNNIKLSTPIRMPD